MTASVCAGAASRETHRLLGRVRVFLEGKRKERLALREDDPFRGAMRRAVETDGVSCSYPAETDGLSLIAGRVHLTAPGEGFDKGHPGVFCDVALFHDSLCSSICSSSSLKVKRGGFSVGIDPGRVAEELQHLHVDLLLQHAQRDIHGAGPLALAAFGAPAGEVQGMDRDGTSSSRTSSPSGSSSAARGSRRCTSPCRRTGGRRSGTRSSGCSGRAPSPSRPTALERHGLYFADILVDRILSACPDSMGSPTSTS